MKRMITVFAVAVLSVSAWATEFYLKSDATDWATKDSYCLDAGRTTPADRLPTAGDNINVPKGAYSLDVSTVAGNSSFDVFANVERIKPADGAVITITVPKGVTKTINSAIYFYTYWYGEIVKEGEGTLLMADGRYDCDYHVDWTINAGIVKCPQKGKPGRPVGQADPCYYGDVYVKEGATLFTTACEDSEARSRYTYFDSLNGGGLLTNDQTRLQAVAINRTSADQKPSVFSGTVAGNLRFYTAGSIDLTGEANAPADFTVIQENNGNGPGYYQGVVGAAKIGNDGQPSSLGGIGLQILPSGGVLRYLGTGEVSARSIRFDAAAYPAYVDGGPFGGLTLTGDWVGRVDAGGDMSKTVYLCGSNSAACVFSGLIGERAKDGVMYPIALVKQGTGTWLLEDNQWRENAGMIGVEEGTLQFTSLAARGTICSLGLATNLVTYTYHGRDLENNRAEHAIQLGGRSAPAATPTLEYVGSADVSCSTRPIGLATGGGALKNSSPSASFVFAGVSAVEPNSTPDFMLGGSSAKANVVNDISDGAAGAKVSVVKRGTGTWTIGGDLSFSGDIRVEEGSLNVVRPEFKWFRFSIAQIGTGGAYLRLREIALFDKDGARQNVGLVALLEGNYAELEGHTEPGLKADDKLQPGQVAYGRSFRYQHNRAYDLDQAFLGTGGSRLQLPLGDAPVAANKTTWIPIVMRLRDDANPVTHFDIELFLGADNAPYWPKKVCIEGSVDGVSWQTVFDNTEGDGFDFTAATTGGVSSPWLSDGTEFHSDFDGQHHRPLTETSGFAMKASGLPVSVPPLSEVSGLRVDGDGSFKTAVPLTVSSLKATTAGLGSFDGVMFAEKGTLDVADLPRGFVSLGGTFVNCTGVENIANWTLTTQDGEKIVNRAIRVTANGVDILANGVLLILK